jgi:transposase
MFILTPSVGMEPNTLVTRGRTQLVGASKRCTQPASRYRVEVFFHNLKRLRAVATRYEKTARNYLALVQIVCGWLWLNEN